MTDPYRKGTDFEREAAKILTSTTGYDWTRVPNSGGLSEKDIDGFSGDLYCKHVKVFVECKSWKNLKFSSLFSNTALKKTIVKTKRQAGDRQWLLMIKHTSNGIYLVSSRWSTLKMLNLIKQGQSIVELERNTIITKWKLSKDSQKKRSCSISPGTRETL